MELLAYSKYHVKLTADPRDKDIHLFGSSSKGNSIYFIKERFLIDLGFPYKLYQAYNPNFFLKVDYVFLTHEHSDHLNPSTLLRVIRNYPNVKFVISKNMWRGLLSESFAHRINQKELIKSNKHFYIAQPMRLTNTQGLEIDYIPHITAHGPINNCAVELIVNNQHILYASDLDEYKANPSRGTQGLPFNRQNPFDIICLEANYDPKILFDYIQSHPHDFRAKQNLRHTSEKDAWEYVEQFLKPDGIFIPLHASSSFGTLLQESDKDRAKMQEKNNL